MERNLAMEEQATLDGTVKAEEEKRRKVVEEMAEKLADELQGRKLTNLNQDLICDEKNF